MQLELIVVLLSCSLTMALRRPRSEYQEFGYLSPERSFNFRFQCGDWNETTCAIAQESIKEVGKLIANDLLFRVPVQVEFKFEYLPQVRYKTLMLYEPGLLLRKVVGDDVGPVLDYPSSLSKQIDLTERLEPALIRDVFSYNNDFMITVNTAFNWTINPDDPNPSLNAIDLQRILILTISFCCKRHYRGIGIQESLCHVHR